MIHWLRHSISFSICSFNLQFHSQMERKELLGQLGWLVFSFGWLPAAGLRPITNQTQRQTQPNLLFSPQEMKPFTHQKQTFILFFLPSFIHSFGRPSHSPNSTQLSFLILKEKRRSWMGVWAAEPLSSSVRSINFLNFSNFVISWPSLQQPSPQITVIISFHFSQSEMKPINPWKKTNQSHPFNAAKARPALNWIEFVWLSGLVGWVECCLLPPPLNSWMNSKAGVVGYGWFPSSHHPTQPLINPIHTAALPFTSISFSIQFQREIKVHAA